MPRSLENLEVSALLKRGSVRVDEWYADSSLIRPLPPLVKALREWQIGSWGPVIDRELETMWGHAPVEFLLQVLNTADQTGVPVFDLTHPPQLTAADNEQALLQHHEQIEEVFGRDCAVKVLKTVTVSFKNHDDEPVTFLVCGFGDFEVSKPLLKLLADQAGVNYKNRHINNEAVFDTDLELNMVPGLVKPLVSPARLPHIDGICYLHLVEESEVGAMTVTLLDSLLTSVGVFEDALRWYWQEVCQTEKVYLYDTTPEEHKTMLDVYMVQQKSIEY